MTINTTWVRQQFPSLSEDTIFFDNPGGTQVPGQVLEAVQGYFLESNANRGGAFNTSRRTDEVVERARAALASFLHAQHPEEIVFGQNMTSLTYTLSRALGTQFQEGDELIVTHLDHDANIAPWLQVAQDRGCEVRWLDFDPQDTTLLLDQLEDLLSPRTRLLAVGYASNAVGTINPLPEILRRAKSAGALTYVDAVHYAPHGPIDVQALEADFLVISLYKIFGPYLGVLYGRYPLLEELPAYKVRPAPEEPPGKFETGTQNHAAIAGALAAMGYVGEIGSRFGQPFEGELSPRYRGQALAFKKGMRAIQAYEQQLTSRLLTAIQAAPGTRIYGITEPDHLDQRVPTVSFTAEGSSPRIITTALTERGVNAWDGNYYALAVTTRLGVEQSGGMVRIGPVHYNTVEEIDRFQEILSEILSQDQP